MRRSPYHNDSVGVPPENELHRIRSAAWGAGVGGDDRNLDAELVRRAGFAFADALGLRGMEGIELPATLALLLGSDLGGARQRQGKRCLDVGVAGDLAADVTD